MPTPIASKKIGVVGCGALGSVFAALLSSAGHEVVGVCRWREHRESIQANGLLLLGEGEPVRIPLCVSAGLPPALSSEAGYDLVIVLVKAFDTEAAAAGLAARLAPETPVLTLQNGLGNAEALSAHLGQNPVLAGTTTFGAQRESPGVVRLTGRGECEIGAWNRVAEEHLGPTADLLTRSGIPTSVSPDVLAVLWKKLAISAVINPLTAILRVRNGELLERDELRPLFAEIVGEVCRVAAEYKIPLPTPAELLHEVGRVCQATAANRSSMLRDVEQGRPTETDAINGAVVRLGRERGVPAPVNLVLSTLIRLISARNDRQ